MHTIKWWFGLKHWFTTSLTIAIYAVLMILFYYGWVEFGFSISLGLPFFVAAVLTIAGGLTTGIINGLILTIFTFGVFNTDMTRLTQNVIPNIVLLTLIGSMSSWSRQLFETSLLNGKAQMLVSAVHLLDSSIDQARRSECKECSPLVLSYLLSARELLGEITTLPFLYMQMRTQIHQGLATENKNDPAN